MLKRLGPFQIERELGSGSLGKVYLAQEGEAGRTVALKVLSGQLFKDPEFMDEALHALDELTRLLKMGSFYDFQR